MLVFFALFIYLGAAQESVAALGRSLTHGIPIRAAMITEFHTWNITAPFAMLPICSFPHRSRISR